MLKSYRCGWVGWVGVVAHKTLVSAPVSIGIGIRRGLGLGLDNFLSIYLTSCAQMKADNLRI